MFGFSTANKLGGGGGGGGRVFCCCFCFEDTLLMEFMYLVFTRMPGETYRKRLRPLLLYLCEVFRATISSVVC